MKILNIEIVRGQDPCSDDLSFIGEYHSKHGREHALDLQALGRWERGNHLYFEPAMTAEETGNPNSPMQDLERMEAYNSGLWYMLSIHAFAEVRLTEGGPSQRIRSGGLHGIESDSDESYLEEVGQEQLEELKAELLTIGFTAEQFQEAL